jgi:hypothetical protein
MSIQEAGLPKWSWEPVDVDHSGSAGDVSKLFRNEVVKQPGVFAINAPPADATVLAREAIQNSWDAARELASSVEAPTGGETPEFTIRFRFLCLDDSERDRMITALGLEELAERAASGNRLALGLAANDCLDHLGEEPLGLLVVEEEGASGMYGPWKGAASRLYLAMVSLGFTAKERGAGGSYGYGKAGLIRGSKVRTVIGYTCFVARPEEPEVTRRLLGMTYWGPHSYRDENFTGFARLGKTDTRGSVIPFENNEADEIATELGLQKRSASERRQLGTTFLLVDPTIYPDDLLKAVERNWWPALQEGMFRVEVVTAEGAVREPRPKRDNDLRAFIRGYELATTKQDSTHDEEAQVELGQYLGRKLGSLGLVADMAGWSYASAAENDDEAVVKHSSLVALVRSPHMVVEYHEVGKQQPHVRGTFLAHDDVDDLLRQTEPKAHDAWQGSLVEEGVDPEAPKVAKELLRRISKEVRDFRKRLKPPHPREQDVRLPVFEDLLKGVLENRGKVGEPPPPGQPRSVAIRISQRVETVGSQILLRAEAKFSLTKDLEIERARCQLHFRYAFDEDGRLGEDCEITVSTVPGFEQQAAGKRGGVVMVGELSHEAVDFEIVSVPYDPDWTGQLIVSGEIIESDGDVERVA